MPVCMRVVRVCVYKHTCLTCPRASFVGQRFYQRYPVLILVPQRKRRRKRDKSSLYHVFFRTTTKAEEVVSRGSCRARVARKLVSVATLRFQERGCKVFTNTRAQRHAYRMLDVGARADGVNRLSSFARAKVSLAEARCRRRACANSRLNS